MSKRSLAKTIISMMLCCIMMMASVMPSFAAEGNDATLSDLRFNDLIVLDFEQGKLDYEAVFPYDNVAGEYYVPEITAIPTDPEATVNVTYPDDITCGAINVTVTAANGTTTQTYTITPTVVGENLYYVGDFEDESIKLKNNKIVSADETTTYWKTSTSNVTIDITDTASDVKDGSKAMYTVATGDGWLYGKIKSGLDAGKMYYGMVDAKWSAHYENGGTESYNRVTGLSTADAASRVNYHGGEKVGTSTVALANSWQRVAFTFTTSQDYDISEFATTLTPWGSHRSTALDNYYLGELAVAKVPVTDQNGKTAAVFTEEDIAEEQTITLSKNILNSAGNSDGLEAASFKEWKVVSNTAGVTVSENGVVTVPANTPAGTYFVEAYYDLTNTGITHDQKTNGVKGAYIIQVSGGAKTLESITAEPGYIEVQDGDYSYDLYIPVKQVNGADTYSVPVITATTADPSHTVEVTYPAEAVEGATATITVKDSDGVTVDVYTLIYRFIGKNLYAVKGFEVAENIRVSDSSYKVIGAGDGVAKWDAANLTSSLVTDEVKTGARAWKVVPTKVAAQWGGTLTSKGKLPANKTYYASVDAKIANEATVESVATTNRLENRVTWGTVNNPEYYIDGTKQLDRNITLTKDWKNFSATFKPAEDTTLWHYFYDGTNVLPALVLDNYYVGELVVSDVEIKAGEFGDKILLNEDGDTEIQLTATAINQFGNNGGLEAATLSEMTLVNAPQGVTLENGTLTIAEGAAVDEITVYAVMEPKHTGNLQSKVAGTVELTVLNPNISYSEAVISAGASIESRLAFVSEVDAEIFFITALYEKADDNTLTLVNAEPKTGTIKTGKLYTDKQTVVIPNDGKTYVIKSFAWNAVTLQPLMGEGVLQ